MSDLPTTVGSVIRAKPTSRKKAFIMALADDGTWVRLDMGGLLSESPPFREVEVMFDAGSVE